MSVSSPLPGGYDEPETLTYQITLKCHTGADVSHARSPYRLDSVAVLLLGQPCTLSDLSTRGNVANADLHKIIATKF